MDLWFNISEIVVPGSVFLAQIAVHTYLYAPSTVTAAWGYDPRDFNERALMNR